MGITQDEYEVLNQAFEAGQLQGEKANQAAQLMAEFENQTYHEQAFATDPERLINPEGIGGTQPPEPPTTMMGEVQGAGDTALTMLSGMTTGTAQGLAAFTQNLTEQLLQGNLGTQKASDLIEQETMKAIQAGTWKPKTQTGQRNVIQIGETLEPLVAIAPLAETANAMTLAAKMPLKAKTLWQAPKPEQAKILDLVVNNSDDVQRAGWMQAQSDSLTGAKLVKAPAAREAIRQKLDKGTVALIQASSGADAQYMQKALDILKGMRKSKTFALEHRPTDVAGDMLKTRFEAVKAVNKTAQIEIKEASKKLQGKTVPVANAYDDFLKGLQDTGVEIVTKKGKLVGNYFNSEFSQSLRTQKALDNFIQRALTNTMDGLEAHRLKRVIGSIVDYGSKSIEDPIVAKGETLLKDLRYKISENLKGLNPEYDAANAKFADTRGAMDKFFTSAGNQFDPNSPMAGQTLSKVSRELMSNSSKRGQATDAINALQEVGKKYGQSFDGDIMKQTAFISGLEDAFRGTQEALTASKVLEKNLADAIHWGKAAVTKNIGLSIVNKIRNINEEQLIKSLDALIKEGK